MHVYSFMYIIYMYLSCHSVRCKSIFFLIYLFTLLFFSVYSIHVQCSLVKDSIILGKKHLYSYRFLYVVITSEHSIAQFTYNYIYQRSGVTGSRLQNVSHDEKRNNQCLYTCKHVYLILIIIFNSCPFYITINDKTRRLHISTIISIISRIKNISSNTDDQFFVIQVYIFSSCSAYPSYLGTYIQFFFKTKNKPCTKNK